MITLVYKSDTKNFNEMSDAITYAFNTFKESQQLPLKILKDSIVISENSRIFPFLVTREHLVQN